MLVNRILNNIFSSYALYIRHFSHKIQSVQLISLTDSFSYADLIREILGVNDLRDINLLDEYRDMDKIRKQI